MNRKMDFSQALVYLKTGKDIRRLCWANNVFIHPIISKRTIKYHDVKYPKHPELFIMFKENGDIGSFKMAQWTPDINDLFAEDWIIYMEEKND